IAQSEALNEKPFANYWMHNGYINIDNEKMSKSLGNFVLVHDIIKQHEPQLIRFFMLSVHYRHPINYSDELLDHTKNGLERLRTSYTNLQHRLGSSTNLTNDDNLWMSKIKSLRDEFIAAMDDDFNTANAISVLFELSKQANYYLQAKNTSTTVIETFITEFDTLFGVLGLTLVEEKELLDEEIEALIEKRIEARKNRDFVLADQIRDELKERNIIL
ncbi:MAG: DALR domain-containing protein, partial [Niallia sp.]